MRIPLFSSRPIFRARALVLIACFTFTSILALLGFTRVIPTLLRVPTQIDFAAYYVAARMLNAHLPLYRSSPIDDIALGIAGIQHTGYLYPPFFAALLRPLALLPYRVAETLWLFCNVVLFLPICTLLLHIGQISKRWALVLFPLGLLLPAVYDTWLLGQVTLLLTLLLLGSLTLAIRTAPRPQHEFLAGILLGVATMIKIYPILLSPIYLRHRRWIALGGFGTSLLITGGLGILFGGGWETTQYWVHSVLPSASGMTPFPSNQSLRGVVARLLTINTFQVPVLNKDNYVTFTLVPVLDSPIISTITFTIGSILILLSTMRVLFRPSSLDPRQLFCWDFAIGTTVMCIITPVVWDFYYVHLVLPIVLFGSVARRQYGLQLVLAVVFLLLALQRYWRYGLLYVQSPWLMMSGFLAVLLLWVAMLVVRGRQSNTA
jgi:hypothetical protein